MWRKTIKYLIFMWLVASGLIGRGTVAVSETLPGQQNRRIPSEFRVAGRDVGRTIHSHPSPSFANHQVARHDMAFPPTTVAASDTMKPWRLTLSEARLISLRNNKDIAYVRYVPLEMNAQIESEDAVFDPVFEFGGAWSRFDRQVSNVVESLGSVYTSTTNDLFNFGPNMPDTVAISKRLRTGGRLRISQGANYDMVNPVGDFVLVNPYWYSSTNFLLEQPLFRGGGLAINRLGICIAQANCQESVHQFHKTVQLQLRDVEYAYWQLYYAHQDLASRRTAVQYALTTWEKEKEKLRLGEGSIPDVAQARVQYEKYRIECNTSEKDVLVQETEFRRVLGIPAYDGRHIVITDRPTTGELVVNWDISVEEAARNRPELNAQREAIRASEMELTRARNGMLPDVAFVANYSLTGLDNQFDQSINRLTEGKYNDWTLGFVFKQPIGRRPAEAATRRAEAVMSRQRAMLSKMEHDLHHELQAVYQELVTAWRALPLYQARREAAAVELDARQQLYSLGEVSVDLYLRTQSAYTEAEREQALGIARYNQAIARWEYTKGTIMRHSNVVYPEEIPSPKGSPLPKAFNSKLRGGAKLKVVRLPPVHSVRQR